MSGAIPPLPQYALMAWCSFKAQGQHNRNLNIKNPTIKMKYEISWQWNKMNECTKHQQH